MSFVTEFKNRLSRLLPAGIPALLLLLSGCTESSVAPEDITYEEIKIDGFAHYWNKALLDADSVSEDKDAVYDFSLDSLGQRYIYIDSLLEQDRLAELPAHVIDSAHGLVYAAKRPPRTFSCTFTRTHGLEYGSTSGTPWMTQKQVLPDGTTLGEVRARASATPATEWAYCEYVEGLGFKVTHYDYFGTITIRY